MTNYRYLTGIHIEGVGDTVAGAAGGYVFYYGKGPKPSGSYAVDTLGTAEFDWVEALDLPREKSDSVDPFTGELRSGSYSFGIDGSDAMAKIFQHTETIPSATLTADISDSVTDIPASNGLLANQVIWVGDEAIKLSGSYSGGEYVGSTRGYFGSTAQNHSSGDHLYEWVSEWANRELTVLRYDQDADQIDVIDKAFVRDLDAKSPEKFIIQTEDYITKLLNAEVNRTPVDYNRAGGLLQQGKENVWGTRLRDLDGSYFTSRVLSRNFPAGETTRGIAVQLGEGLVRSIESKDGDDKFVGIFTNIDGRVRLGSSIGLEEADDDEPDDRPYEGEVWELLVIDRVGDENNASSEYISATRTLAAARRYHPVGFSTALIRSRGIASNNLRFQTFGEDWSLGLDYVDLDSFESELDNSPDLENAIDHIVWGWGGSGTRLGEKLRQLLRTWGFFKTKDSKGRLGLSRLRALDISAYSEALSNSVQPFRGQWGWKSPRASQSNTVFAKVGELPWRAGSTVSVTSEGTSKRSKLLADKQNRYDIEAISRGKALAIAQQLSNVALIGHYGIPRITVNVPSEAHSGASYGLGEWISFTNVPMQNRVLIDRNREVVNGSDVEGRVDLIGMIVGRKISLESYAAELEVLLMAYRTGAFARERAPSMFITGSAVSNTRLYCAATSEFGNSTPDNESFTVGDECKIWYIDGEEVASTVQTITDIGNDGTDYVDIIPGAATITADIMVLRLADGDEFENTTRYSGIKRPYAYFASGGGIVTTVGAEDPDPYGGVLGVSS